MKYIYKAIIVVSVLILTTNAHAAFVSNWSVDSLTAGKLFGKMMIIENYGGGMKYITSLDEAVKTSMWNGLTASKADMEAAGGGSLMISCYLGGCIVISESNNVVSASNDDVVSASNDDVVSASNDDVVSTSNDGGPFQAAPVPIPAAAWLFMSGLISLVWKGRKVRKSFS
jgi:hypothetical protein